MVVNDRDKSKLYDLGVDIFEAETKKEEQFSDALDAFSWFVLIQHKDRCEEIIESRLDMCVGELAGGNE